MLVTPRRQTVELNVRPVTLADGAHYAGQIANSQEA